MNARMLTVILLSFAVALCIVVRPSGWDGEPAAGAQARLAMAGLAFSQVAAPRP